MTPAIAHHFFKTLVPTASLEHYAQTTAMIIEVSLFLKALQELKKDL